MNQQFIITAERSPNPDDAEMRHRLVWAYAIILDYAAEKAAADRESLTSTTRSPAEAATSTTVAPS